MSGKPSKIDKNVETEQIPPPTEIFFLQITLDSPSKYKENQTKKIF